MQEVHCEEIFIILIYFKMAFVTKLTTGLRTLSTNVSLQAPIKEFVVIGGGLMGAGIAQVGAQTGHKVTLVDLSQVSQGNSLRGIRAVGRYENPGVPVVIRWAKFVSLVEIGLTDLPKSGCAMKHPAHPGMTGLK